MDTLPSIQDGSTPLVTYAIGDGETIVEAIVGAFAAIGVDPYERDSPLYEWIHVDCFERLEWRSGNTLRVSTVIWDHPTVVTGETVKIYK